MKGIEELYEGISLFFPFSSYNSNNNESKEER